MAQYSAQEIDQMFDPTQAPAWSRVSADDQQAIQAGWDELKGVAHYLVNVSPDDDEQAPRQIDELKRAALRQFDAVVSENLNEPPA